ncbi:hypothetical protein CIHG_06050 [Coccidioides immitis H538.4]|uniref:Uncharacterized protein n=1 Tax=Coccidioides immitis H538.4 TaxID=396776 RepID=A0A0J8RSW3_COCIT|nr:hypothetical protein CIHG_06050 [Coccidioides immitis H538.4]
MTASLESELSKDHVRSSGAAEPLTYLTPKSRSVGCRFRRLLSGAAPLRLENSAGSDVYPEALPISINSSPEPSRAGTPQGLTSRVNNISSPERRDPCFAPNTPTSGSTQMSSPTCVSALRMASKA